ncbi:MAG: RDD family protein [Xanthomonadales bacterium]|nr:RDD family protein [Xanthomonadales bacterium]
MATTDQRLKDATYPSIARRYFATALDMIVIIGLITLIIKIFKAVGMEEGPFWAVAFAPVVLYEPLLTGLAATIGQVTFRFRVRDPETRRPIGVLRAYLRWLLKILLGLISLLTIPRDRYRRAIHDRSVDSVAINVGALAKPGEG